MIDIAEINSKQRAKLIADWNWAGLALTEMRKFFTDDEWRDIAQAMRGLGERMDAEGLSAAHRFISEKWPDASIERWKAMM